MTNVAAHAAKSAHNSRPLRFLARLGFAVNGLLHALIGIIAIGVAVGAGGEADQSGALSAIAATPGGRVTIWVVFVGLLALGVWLIVDAFLTTRRSSSKRALHVVSEIAKGIAYLAVSATAFSFARGASTDSAQSTTQVSATLLAAPGGAFVVVVIGVLIFGIGVYFVVKGATRRFTRDLNLPSGRAGRATVVLGVFGYVAKGIALGVVGILFCVAAATVNPSTSSGLDGGLKALASLPFGAVILIVVGLGLIAYAAYSFVRSRYARL